MYRKNAKLGCGPVDAAEGGFTLIEILLVIVIMSVLAAVVMFAVLGVDQASAVSACKTDYKTIATAQEAYRTQVGASATSFAQLEGTTVGVNGDEVGPWIKEAPSSDKGYAIGFDTTPGPTYGNITVSTSNPAHPAQNGDTNCAYA